MMLADAWTVEQGSVRGKAILDFARRKDAHANAWMDSG